MLKNFKAFYRKYLQFFKVGYLHNFTTPFDRGASDGRVMSEIKFQSIGGVADQKLRYQLIYLLRDADFV
jgi:hypothetical protein